MLCIGKKSLKMLTTIYIKNYKVITNIHSEFEIEFATPASYIKCRKVITELHEGLDALRPTASLLIAQISEVIDSNSNNAPHEIISSTSELPSEALPCFNKNLKIFLTNVLFI